MREAKTKLVDLDRREQKYHNETWKNRTEIIEAWSRIVEQNPQENRRRNVGPNERGFER
jgi:hypothetical protein